MKLRIASVLVSLVAIIGAGTVNLAGAASCETNCTPAVVVEKGPQTPTAPIEQAPAPAEQPEAAPTAITLPPMDVVAPAVPKKAKPVVVHPAPVEVVESAPEAKTSGCS